MKHDETMISLELHVYSLCVWLQIRGEHLDTFIAQNQDKSRNAHEKSLQAAFAAWAEDLKADQTKWEAEQILFLGCVIMSAPFPSTFCCLHITHFYPTPHINYVPPWNQTFPLFVSKVWERGSEEPGKACQATGGLGLVLMPRNFPETSPRGQPQQSLECCHRLHPTKSQHFPREDGTCRVSPTPQHQALGSNGLGRHGVQFSWRSHYIAVA